MEIPAQVTGHDGSTIDATLYDLSPDGAQIRYAVADGLNLFSGKDSASRKNSKNLKCLLQFRLEMKGGEKTIKIHAQSVYLRPVDKETLASGLFFNPADQSEKKLIRKYLLSQLEESYADLGQLLSENLTTMPSRKPVAGRTGTGTPNEKGSVKPGPGSEAREKSNPEDDMESLKLELLKVQSSLNVIQEAIQTISEKITQMEKKPPPDG